MARMFPDEVERFTTPGEGDVYNFLRNVARPDAEHIVWYSPDIEAREPDFILLSTDCGLIVLEVKDWTIGQILEMDPKSALLRIGKREERRKQPLAQAREYVNNILSLFSKHARRDARGGYESPCPVTYGAVLPHISRADWDAAGLGKVVEDRRILFWDDLQDFSPLRKDVSGKTFREWLKGHFPPLFPFTLTEEKKDWLRNLVFPIARLNLPKRAGASEQAEIVRLLDQDQENLARNLGADKMLVHGPAGSGKTLVLASRACYLPKTDNNIRRVLLTCFNLSLAGYIRRLVSKRGASLGPEGVEVIPFYKLCEKIIGEPLEHTNETGDYYKMVVDECRERLAGNHPLKGHWDVALVDEGQDFTPEMAEVVLGLVKDGRRLAIAEDVNQSLYQDKSSSWENLPGLRKYKLGRQYRNTRQISSYAADFLGMEAPEPAGAEGEKPEMLLVADECERAAMIAKYVAKLVENGQPMSEIAVLYFSARNGANRDLPQRLMAELESHGILSRWLSRDISSKNFYDITTDSVTISTVHSVKGMDFANVCIADFDMTRPENEHQKRLAYVAMTRARERLFLCARKK